MEIKDLIGIFVEHKIFGQGIVEDAYEKYMEVRFTQRNKICKFSYPSCFDGYLNLITDEKRVEVEADLVLWRIESGAEKKEELKQLYMKTQQAIIARRVAAEEKKLRAAQRSMNRSQYNLKKNDNKK